MALGERNISVDMLNSPFIEDQPIELVERKGLGHPDSLCDGISEAVSRALSRMYLDSFGRILHHNTDETHIVGGQAVPAFGGGKVTQPAYVVLVGRATTEVDGEKLPYRQVAMDAAREYLKSVCSHLDIAKHIELDCRIGQGSVDLRGVFEGEGFLANDTSFGCGYAPLSEVETLVLETERFLTLKLKKKLPALGEDVKVMGCRQKDAVTLTVAAAMVGREIADKKAYVETLEKLREEVVRHAADLTHRELSVAVNTGDNPAKDVYYLTVTGLSMENGDDGSTGRGNRVNGLITPYRPMSMEATSGKNPITHVGKIYNLLSNEIARDIVKEAGGDVREVNVRILSQIGKPVDRPLVAALNVLPAEGVPLSKVEPLARDVADRWLSRTDTVPQKLLTGKLTTF
jgi:S-adenosylmethionine synthetase